MRVINKTYRFRICPDKEQEVLLDKHFGCIRYVYNYFLNERKEQYQADKKSDNYYKQAATLTELKKKDENNLFIATFFVYLQYETKKIITQRKNRVIYPIRNW